MSLDINEIREQFPNLRQTAHGKPLIYLDNAASTLKCRPVIDALNTHYSREVSNIHRGVHFYSEQGTQKYEQTRKTIQHFINAQNSYQIIFTKGTTDSLNLVAHSYGGKNLAKGDVILLSTLEHHSNIVPWQIIAERTGAIVKEIPINDQGEILQDEYLKLLKENQVKIVSINHISNSLGTINPIKQMISKLRELHKAAVFCVDAAQSIAHEKVDVKDLDCDFLAFSSHKIFGPTGVGVLYGKEELLNSMPPYQGGGDMIDQVSFEKTTYNDLPHKFEAGTPHIAGVIALNEALEYVSRIGLENISAYEEELLQYATKKMSQIEGLRIIGTAKKKSAVISFAIDGAHPHDIGMLLDRQGIAIRTGHHCTQPLMKRLGVPATARASFCFYNTKEEIDILVDAIIKTKEFL